SAWLTSGCRSTIARRHRVIACTREPGSDCAAGSKRMGRFQKLSEQRTRQGRGERVALGKQNSALAQIFHLAEILDAFGDDLHPHAACELDEGFNDRRRIALRSDGIDE